ncbi:hypothetical protein [Pseudoalteromonas sp. bablab_jr004]|uniref:hypothetical protein n=1 Tax=Pseudoalteromonas sp. bablab_jr004 TaxID=2755065 RepID=UPI0018F3BD35|nr:hypothetical protein [Pseudoalteromonas sp. bablab_jr004]
MNTTKAENNRVIKNSLMSWVLLTVSHLSIAEETWGGLVVKQENRCSPYNKKAQYPYPKCVEDEVFASVDGVVYGSDTDMEIEHIVGSK